MNRRGFIKGSAAFAAAALASPHRAIAAIADPDLSAMARRIVEKTLEKLEAARNEPDNPPVILLLGEFHNQPKHIIVQILVLDELRRRGVDFSVGLELPHDEIFKSFAKFAHGDWQNWDRTKVDALKSYDPRGHHALKSAMLWQESTGGDAHRMIWNFLIHRNITAQFNDVAWSPGAGMKRIDLRDPATVSLTRKVFGRDFATLPLPSPEGLLLRNHFMKESALTQVKRFGVPLIVQLCGTGHITGAATPPRAFSDSLPVLLKKSGIPFIAAPFMIDDETGNVAADYALDPEDGITDLVLPNENGGGDKKGFIRAVLTEYGINPALADTEDDMAHYQTELEQLFEIWREQQATATPAAPLISP